MRPFNGFLFDSSDALLVSYPLLNVEPLLEERFGLVACHLQGEYTVHEIPDGLDVLLACLHVNVHRPKIPAFGVRIDNALEERFAALSITELVLELSEAGDRFEVYKGLLDEISAHAD